MADISVTAANVKATGSTQISHEIAAVALAAGQVVYKVAASGKVGLADSNSGTAEVKVAYGVALNAAAADQPVAVARGGSVNMGATLVAGTMYALSETPGGVQPAADLASGEAVAYLGVATTTALLDLRINNSGVTL